MTTRDPAPAGAQQDDEAARVGRHVRCSTCGRAKKPIGRDESAAAAGSMCTSWDCDGYYADPQPDHLWPGEREWLDGRTTEGTER